MPRGSPSRISWPMPGGKSSPGSSRSRIGKTSTAMVSSFARTFCRPSSSRRSSRRSRRIAGPCGRSPRATPSCARSPSTGRLSPICPACERCWDRRTGEGLVRYAGSRDAEPVVWIQSILRHACPGTVDPQTLLHADTFHPTVKAWLFLTDVAEDAGPFTYVPGSHRLTAERLAWERRMSLGARQSENAEIRQGSFRIDPEELPSLGLPPPRAFAVPANTLVVADTFGFHARGPSLGPSLRVEIWAYGRRSPFLPFRRSGSMDDSRLGAAQHDSRGNWATLSRRPASSAILGEPDRAYRPSTPRARTRSPVVTHAARRGRLRGPQLSRSGKIRPCPRRSARRGNRAGRRRARSARRRRRGPLARDRARPGCRTRPLPAIRGR